MPVADEYTRDEFTISTDRGKLDLDMMYEYLTNCYWSPGITRDRIRQFIPHSLCFGLYNENRQIGFARVITDYSTFAYVADVFVLDGFRGRGLGKWLIKTIVEHPGLQDLRRWVLFTQDAHGLYARFGFTRIDDARSCMQILAPTVSKPDNR